ncbi:MAG: NYN domain-containing protein [Syntrophobacteraceae bacterium]|nr:NYN domain-containing protein [Syntrophobacteraceae bacterium]
MEPSLKDSGVFSKLPLPFYELVVRDIPAPAWGHILESNPDEKIRVLEGYSIRKAKSSQIFHRPPVLERLCRELQTNAIFFGKVIGRWRAEKPTEVSYLAMFSSDFISRNVWKLRDLFGPALLCAGLCSLGLLDLARVVEALETEAFWSRAPDAALFDILVPTLSVWGQFIENHPDISEKFLDSKSGDAFLFDLESDRADAEETEEEPSSRSGPLKKVEKKLRKVQSELDRAVEQLGSLRNENEALRKKMIECEKEFEKKLVASISLKRKEWFERYRSIDREEAVKESERLGSLLQRTRRALELQKRADEEYGVLSDIREKLLETDLALNRIEAVYAGSLVVHKEVEKVKEALLAEKTRLLKLPGIAKVIGAEQGGAAEIVARINLLDAVPANLPKINEMRKVAGALVEIGLIADPSRIEEAGRHKKRQIFERLYFQFEPKRKLPAHQTGPRYLDDFLKSGQSRRYDLFIDGYNVLLRAHGEDENFKRGDFTKFRNRFIEAVSARSRYFAKVWLIFDGIEESSGVAGNVQIIYTDKAVHSADEALIEKISARKDGKILLVTGDEGIISAVADKIFALIDVADFYMFLFE